MVLRRRFTHAAACLAVLFTASIAHAQAPVLSPPAVNGNAATLSWSATNGATGYRLDYALAPGAYLGNLPVGVVTSFTIPSVPNGIYYLRVVAQTAGGDVASNEVTLRVPTPPTTPVAVQATSYCNAVLVTWAPGAGGGAPSGYQVKIGTSPGGTIVVVPSGTTKFYSPAPAGTYYFRIAAVAGGAVSADSTEVSVTTNASAAAAPAVTLANNTFGSLANIGLAAPGASSYSVNGYVNGAFVGTFGIPGASPSITRYVGPATYRLDVTPVYPCGAGGASSITFTTPDPATAKMQPRAADPAAGTALPTPNYALGIIRDLGARYQGELNNSCRERGGNNAWLFRVLAQLRTIDKRWGVNWKRANVGDMSQDILTYNWSDEPDEGTFNTRVYDVIGNHCGTGNYSAQMSEVTILGSRGSIWTIKPYLEAGFLP